MKNRYDAKQNHNYEDSRVRHLRLTIAIMAGVILAAYSLMAIL